MVLSHQGRERSQSLLKFMPLESLMHPTISSSAALSPFTFNLSQNQGLF